MRLTLTLLVVFLLAGANACANDVIIESGPGLFRSFYSLGIFLKFHKDTSRLFGFPSYWEAIGAYWNNDNHAAGLAIARGIEWRKAGKKAFFSTDFGGMRISRTTQNLGTDYQFYSRVGYNIKINGRQASIGLIHISNGKLVFGWDGPNSGENFLTLSTSFF